MARHPRRLITWIGGAVLALVALALLAVLILVWFVDPNAWRSRIANSASTTLGRQVLLGGDLVWHVGWDMGWNIAIASEGGAIANAAGFDARPFAQWQRLRLGLNARALLGKRIVIDQLAIEGLQINLQRNSAGAGNWVFATANPGANNAADAASTADKPIPLQIATVRLRKSQLTFTDALGVTPPGKAVVWQLGDLALDVTLPPDLHAPQRELRNVAVRGRLSGGPLPAAGVAVAFDTESVKQDAVAATLSVPAFAARWDDAQLSGSVDATYGATPDAHGKLALRVPSVRNLLASVSFTPPPMADPATLGRLDVSGAFEARESSLAIAELQAVLDDTKFGGTVSVTRFTPFSMRFDLEGDAVNVDRYLEPADYKGKPFELPLAQLQALNVQGVLRMKSATVKGAKATELRVDVE
jgi:AsmA protein